MKKTIISELTYPKNTELDNPLTLLMSSRKICIECGKKLHNIVDTKTKKKSKYQWRCSCWPKGVVLMIG